MIKEQQAKLKETGIRIELHKEIAYRFLDELDGDGEDCDEEEEYKKEMRKVYLKLRTEEERTKNLEEEISKLRLKEKDYINTEQETKESSKRLEANLNSKIEEQEKEMEESKKRNKKEIKQLKDAISDAEVANSEYKKEIKNLEEKLEFQVVAAQVQNITRIDILMQTQSSYKDMKERTVMNYKTRSTR